MPPLNKDEAAVVFQMLISGQYDEMKIEDFREIVEEKLIERRKHKQEAGLTAKPTSV